LERKKQVHREDLMNADMLSQILLLVSGSVILVTLLLILVAALTQTANELKFQDDHTNWMYRRPACAAVDDQSRCETKIAASAGRSDPKGKTVVQAIEALEVHANCTPA
jgi:hypothetical protein